VIEHHSQPLTFALLGVSGLSGYEIRSKLKRHSENDTLRAQPEEQKEITETPRSRLDHERQINDMLVKSRREKLKMQGSSPRFPQSSPRKRSDEPRKTDCIAALDYQKKFLRFLDD